MKISQHQFIITSYYVSAQCRTYSESHAIENDTRSTELLVVDIRTHQTTGTSLKYEISTTQGNPGTYIEL